MLAIAHAASDCEDPQWRKDVDLLLGKLEGIAVAENPSNDDKRFLIDHARLAVSLIGGDSATEEKDDITEDDIQNWIEEEVNKENESQEEHALNVAFNK